MRSILSLSLAVLALAAVSLRASPPPNLVVIMTDDLGYADVGFNGAADIRTPHIDALAAEGVIFTNGYVTYPVCSPSRAGFITGRYPQRFGYERNPQYKPKDASIGLPPAEDTIAEVLRAVGYRSAVIGKWHLGAHHDLHPLRAGFDYFFGHLGGGHHYSQDLLDLPDSMNATNEGESYRTWILRNHEPVKISKYLTDEFTDEAVRFIGENRDQPFFLFLSYNAPHTPMEATPEYLDRYPDIRNPKRRTYAAMVSAVDDGVGRVMDQLKQLGLDRNTLVFFLSDNGGPSSANASNNAPLRGNKSDVWEGGWRVPFVLRWPDGGFPQGIRYDQPISSMDMMGTIAALADAPIASERPLDGVNLVPFLTGERAGPPHEVIYLRKWDQKAYAVRKGDYKLVIADPKVGARLFDLGADLGERNNLSAIHPEKLAELDALRLQWEAQLIEPQFPGLIQSEWWKKESKKK